MNDKPLETMLLLPASIPDPKPVQLGLFGETAPASITRPNDMMLLSIWHSESEEWYTPPKYINAVREVLGDIDVDPASNAYANQTVQAKVFYDAQTNGMDKEWKGKVFLNPPYCYSTATWISRLIEQYRRGITTEAILLINAAPERKWFKPLWNYVICFTDHRIKFYRPSGESGRPTWGNAFVYMGSNVERFASVFERFGTIANKYRSA